MDLDLHAQTATVIHQANVAEQIPEGRRECSWNLFAVQTGGGEGLVRPIFTDGRKSDKPHS